MATKYGKDGCLTSPGLSLQEGFLPLPNRLHLRIASNLNCFDFELTADDMELLRHLPVKQVHQIRHQRFLRENYSLMKTEEVSFSVFKTFQ